MTAEAPQDPPGFVARTELDKAANDNGYREFKGPGGGWRGWTSTTAPGRVHLAALSDAGPWLLAVDHAGVLAELATAGAPWLGQRPAG
ncbi:MAG: hypothetical protein FJX53_14670, partial [Alphaproteobacteria bacterium]|nr:hypothetical protein [Alphaproteobacteria bacterium]